MEEDSIGDEVEIKYGFCKMELFQEYENIFHMSLVDSEIVGIEGLFFEELIVCIISVVLLLSLSLE